MEEMENKEIHIKYIKNKLINNLAENFISFLPFLIIYNTIYKHNKIIYNVKTMKKQMRSK